MGNVLGLTPSSSPAILQALLLRLPGLYLTSRYAVDDNMVIHQVIHHYQLISWMCVSLLFLTVTAYHTFSCTLKFPSFDYMYFVLIIFVKSGNNKNILTMKNSGTTVLCGTNVFSLVIYVECASRGKITILIPTIKLYMLAYIKSNINLLTYRIYLIKCHSYY